MFRAVSSIPCQLRGVRDVRRNNEGWLWGEKWTAMNIPFQSDTIANFGLHIALFLFYPTGILTSEKQRHCFFDERQNCVTRSDLYENGERLKSYTQSLGSVPHNTFLIMMAKIEQQIRNYQNTIMYSFIYLLVLELKLGSFICYFCSFLFKRINTNILIFNWYSRT